MRDSNISNRESGMKRHYMVNKRKILSINITEDMSIEQHKQGLPLFQVLTSRNNCKLQLSYCCLSYVSFLSLDCYIVLCSKY